VFHPTQAATTHLANCNAITIFVRRMKRYRISVPGTMKNSFTIRWNWMRNEIAETMWDWSAARGRPPQWRCGGGANKTASLCLLFRTTLNQPKMWSSNPTQTKHYNHSSERANPVWQPRSKKLFSSSIYFYTKYSFYLRLAIKYNNFSNSGTYIVYLARGKKKLRGFSPPANYTDRVTAACRRS
jgi:hypothetical protein